MSFPTYIKFCPDERNHSKDKNNVHKFLQTIISSKAFSVEIMSFALEFFEFA